MTYTQLKRLLIKAGFTLESSSKHEWLTNGKVKVRVPHTHKGEVPNGTVNSILKQAGLK